MKSDWNVFIINTLLAFVVTLIFYFTNVVGNNEFERIVIFLLTIIWFYQMDIYRKK